MQSRLKLHELLLGIIDTVYFQPPSSDIMNYPCIRYKLNTEEVAYANNARYFSKNRYELILIDEDPDSNYVEAIKQLPLCSFDRTYCSDNLNHWVFNLYF